MERWLIDGLQDVRQAADVAAEVLEQFRGAMSHVGEQPSFEMCHCPHEVSTPPASVEHGERAAIRRADDARRRGAVLAEVRQHPLLCLEQRPFLARVRDLEDESATAICAIDDEILIAFAGELSRAALPA